LILSVFCAASTANGLHATLSALDGYGVRASEVSLSMNVHAEGGVRLSVSAASVSLFEPDLTVHDVVVLCTPLTFGDDKLRCDNGSVSFRHRGSSNTLRLTFDHRSSHTAFTIGPSTVLGGRLTVAGRRSDAGLELNARFDVDELADIAAVLVSLGWPASLQLTDGGAHASITLNTGDGEFLLELADVAWSDETGLRAAEGLAGVVQGTFSTVPSGLSFKLHGQLDGGAVIHDSFYLEASPRPQRVEVDGNWRREPGVVDFERISLIHPGVLEASGRSVIALAPPRVDRFDVQISRTAVKPVYETYLQPLAWGTPFEDIEVDGDLELNASWSRGGDGWASASIHQLSFDDQSNRFAVYGLDGELHWDASARPQLSSLEWEGGSVYAIDIGASRIEGRLESNRFELTSNVSVPVLDGSLEVNRFDVDHIGTDAFQWTTSAALMPISLETLTHAFGWPAFSGTVAGGIPQISYSHGRLAADGSLLMSVFDGDVLIRNLAIDDAFGLIPEMRANVDVWGLSLELLTRAFSFGDIQGRLDGGVHGLVLENWSPVAFDAEFRTPTDDDSRHRISQNAVDSLASLGGGAGALSSTFLGFFDTFSYDRLGVSCRLENGICTMGGVAPAEQGYYIVKGGGLPPRIDVRGFNDRVAWKTLLERLVNITRSAGPIIQ